MYCLHSSINILNDRKILKLSYIALVSASHSPVTMTHVLKVDPHVLIGWVVTKNGIRALVYEFY